VLEPGPKAVFYRLQKTNARSKMLWLQGRSSVVLVEGKKTNCWSVSHRSTFADRLLARFVSGAAPVLTNMCRSQLDRSSQTQGDTNEYVAVSYVFWAQVVF
jgi:hypothetical protein